jgi:hypothetical protein
MKDFDPSRPWEWGKGATPDDQELQRLLLAGKVIEAVVPNLGAVEVRLNGRTGALDVWLELLPDCQGPLREVLQEGARAIIYTLAGLERDVRVELRAPGALRLGLRAGWSYGAGVLILWEGGAKTEVPV